MLKQTDFAQFEPLLRLHQHLASAESSLVDQVLRSVAAVPLDQPHAATVVDCLLSSFIAYMDTLGPLKKSVEEIVDTARHVCTKVSQNRSAIEGTPPRAQLQSRLMRFPVWGLAITLRGHHRPLYIALGAEVALTLLIGAPIRKSLCTALRRDIHVLGRHPAPNGELAGPDDLAAQGFGAKWISTYRRADRMVRTLACLTRPPSGPSEKLSTVDLIARLNHRFDYPDAARRTAAEHRGCVRTRTLRKAGQAIRRATERGDDDSFMAVACVLTGFSIEAALRMPLVSQLEHLDGIGLARDGKNFLLDLNTLFAGRAVPSAETRHLFKASGHIARFNCPLFFSKEVERRIQLRPHAQHLGDLVDACGLSSRSELLPGENCKLRATLARVSKSLAPAAMRLGLDRLLVAFVTWDFTLITRAQVYYARFTGADLTSAAERLFSTVEWLPLAASTDNAQAFGSHCVLKDEAVELMFSTLAEKCAKLHPGRRGGLDRLLAHHTAYRAYTGAILTFMLGAREARAYGLSACHAHHDLSAVVLHDKLRADATKALPVPLNTVVQEQLKFWKIHCMALAKRMRHSTDARARTLSEHLDRVGQSQEVPLLGCFHNGAIRPAGSGDVWGELPMHIRPPANAGRHYWMNRLREENHPISEIAVFMRHSAVLLDAHESGRAAAWSDARDRICETQLIVAKALKIKALNGLRKA